MADLERQPIVVKGRQALQYVDAIEGLIFDPQPYRFPESATAKPEEIRTRGRLRLPWLRQPQQEPARDPLESILHARWGYFVSCQLYGLVEADLRRDPEEDDREFVYGSPLYKIAERPSVVVDTGSPRIYQVDLQKVRDSRYAIVFSFLHLQQEGVPQAEGNLFMIHPGIMRMGRDGKLVDPYIPSFVEQQRLLAVSELLRKHP